MSNNIEVQVTNPTMSSLNDISYNFSNTFQVQPMQSMTQSVNDSSAAVEWEKSLFRNSTKEVDFLSYATADKFFNNIEAGVNGVEVSFANYQQSLLQVLQHCYGYFYMLQSDKDIRAEALTWIDAEIKSKNITSNSNNTLYAKIVKLAWSNTEIDRKRISTYANLLNNAYTKGKAIEGKTDDNGCVLPKYFAEVVTENGGINSFSRMSKNSIESNANLKEQGFESSRAKNLYTIVKAIDAGEYNVFDKKRTIAPIDFAEQLKTIGDGEFAVVLVRKDKNCVVPLYALNDASLSESLLLKMNYELDKNLRDSIMTKKQAKERYGVELVTNTEEPSEEVSEENRKSALKLKEFIKKNDFV